MSKDDAQLLYIARLMNFCDCLLSVKVAQKEIPDFLTPFEVAQFHRRKDEKAKLWEVQIQRVYSLLANTLDCGIIAASILNETYTKILESEGVKPRKRVKKGKGVN